jgi:protein-arginine kinase activator protein McsA
MIEQKDLKAFHAITQFKNTYREWYETCALLERAVAAGHQEEAETIRDTIRELRSRRDYHRKLLVGYLDKTYPSHFA